MGNQATGKRQAAFDSAIYKPSGYEGVDGTGMTEDGIVVCEACHQQYLDALEDLEAEELEEPVANILS